MRRLAIWAIVLGCGASSAALAQPAAEPLASAAALNQAAFASNGAGLVQWNSSELALNTPRPGAAVDSLQVSVGQLSLGPGGLPMAVYGAQLDTRNYQVTMLRRWPSLVTFGAAGLKVDVSPQAGVGMDSYGGRSAVAGATVGLSTSRSEIAGQRLKDMGVQDGRVFGDRGRWYLFAAASGRSVGLNMLRGDQGWSRAGWSTDPTSRLVGDQQVGVGFLKGPLQTSLGYVHRDMKADHLMYGVDPHSESMVALSFAIRRK
ncbi:MAG: DUF2219 family protein [Phenylobacterium sp.]|nr:MAG: DUF2219 family protein [Phenylobacterium sp.]